MAAEEGRELIGIFESQLVGNFLYAHRGGAEQMAGFRENYTHDRRLGGEACAAFDNRIEMVGVHVQCPGIVGD